MSHQDDGRAAAVEVLQQAEHVVAGTRVETAGRLVGEDQSRAVGQRACDGDLLLLAAGETPCAGPPAILQADQLEQVARALAALLELDARERHGECDVVLDRHRRDEVEGLEDGAHALEAVVRELTVGHLAEREARAIDMAAGRPVEAAHERQQRALAAARRADDGYELARADVEGHVLERGHVHLVAAAELAGDGVQAQADRLAEEVAELVRRLGRGRLLGSRRFGILRRDDRYRRVGVRVRAAVRRVGFGARHDRGGGLRARARTAALGTARLTGIVHYRCQPAPSFARSLSPAARVT